MPEHRCQLLAATASRRPNPEIATGIVLLSLCSVAEAHRLSGTVTYYGGSDRLCGRRTASGAVLNCGAMTAAYRTLPFGTVLSVQSGGRSIQVTVTDAVRSAVRSLIYHQQPRARSAAAVPIET